MSTPAASTGEAESGDDEPILSVRNLTTVFRTDRETVRAVDGIDLDIREGETVGLVGESGSGKSVTARSIMGLVDSPGEILPGSSIRFRGEELTEYTEEQYKDVRGSGIGLVFQDPLKSLNPVYTVGNQIKETLKVNRGITGAEATKEAIDLLEAVSIPDAARRLNEYPHQFSGGMRQRAIIAMMLACDPEVLICDEPTTALDVTIQAQILELLQDLQAERGLSLLFITHDMGVIAEMADRVNVMYAGEIVERAPVGELFENPKHPYTRGLLEAIPGSHTHQDRLRTIEGDVPTPTEEATSCRFAPRCPEAFDDCEEVHPVLVDVSDDENRAQAGRDSEQAGTGGSRGRRHYDEHLAACLLYPDDLPRPEAVAHHAERGQTADEAADGANVGTETGTDATPDGGVRKTDTASSDRSGGR